MRSSGLSRTSRFGRRVRLSSGSVVSSEMQMDDDTFYSRQSEILGRTANALIEATPAWWRNAIMVVEKQPDGFGYAIRCEQYPQDIVTPTEDVFSAVFELQDLFQKRGKLWTRAVFTLQNEADEWSYDVEYEY